MTPPRTTRSLTKPSTSTASLKPPHKLTSERDKILSNWRRNYCATGEEVSTKMKELAKVSQDDVLEKERNIWTRSTPADLFYVRDEENLRVIKATPRLLQLCEAFNENLVLRAKKVNELKPKYVPPPRKNRARVCKHKSKWYCTDFCFIISECLVVLQKISKNKKIRGKTNSFQFMWFKKLKA